MNKKLKDEAKCKGASIGIKSKVFWVNFKSGRVKKKNLAREALSEVVAVKEKTAELFDLCKKAVAMKQIKIASPGKDRKKPLEEKLRTGQGKFPLTKILMRGRITFLTFQKSRGSLVLMSLFNRSFTSCWIVARGSL